MTEKTMKAVYYEEFGGPEVLQFGERPMPQIAADEVLVQVAAAGINPIDRRLRGRHDRQDFFTTRWPIIPGWDFSGRIAKTGPLVKEWQVGDEVAGLAFTWHLHYGTYAEYLPIKASSIVRKPQALSFVDTAALPLVSLTAWQALTEHSQLSEGQTVFIQAGAGGVGSVAITMAKYLGAKVYTTCGTNNIDYTTSRGADIVIDYTKQDYVSVLTENEPHGLDVVVEGLNNEEAVQNAIKIARDGGTVVYLSHSPPDSDEIKNRNIRAGLMHHHPDAEMLESLLKLYAEGILKLPHVKTMPLRDAAEAHQELEAWHVRGKVALLVSDF